MKKIARITVLLLVAAVMSVAAVACTSAPAVEISEVKLAQTVFVQGEDLSLAGGKLTVITEDATEVVDADAEGVTVSGFDKTATGEQVITVSYRGGSKTVTVNVVPRMSADSYEAKYFVGEEFDTSKGRLKITRNNGTTFVVPMNDDAVSIEFDSSAAATSATVTAHYQSGNDNYTGTFDVAVYAVEEATLHKPNKEAYKSHDSGLDLSGGYIMLKHSEYQKAVVLSPSMVSGFDLTAATDANRETPLVQTLNVKYASANLSYDVKITYSDVSYIRQSATSLTSIDWTGESMPSITKAQGDVAIEAMRLYLGLSDADKLLITADEQTAIVRAATVYGTKTYETEIAKYPNVFGYEVNTETGKKSLAVKNTATNAQVKAAHAALSAKPEISEIGETLTEMATAYQGYKFFGENTVDVYVSGAVGYDGVLANIGIALDLYKNVENVPADWTRDTVAPNAELAAAATIIKENTQAGALSYNLAASWRTDLFEILYAYCFKTNDTDMLKKIAGIQPYDEKFEDLIFGVYYATIYSMAAPQGVYFMSEYYTAVDACAEIAASTDEMIQWIFETFGYKDMVDSLKTMDNGYFARMGSVANDAAVEALWREYIEIVDKLTAYIGEVTEEDEAKKQEEIKKKMNEFFASDEFATLAPDMYQKFVDLMPTQRMCFLSSLDSRYMENAGKGILFFLNNEYQDYFPMFVEAYYKSILSDNAFKAFDNLALAIECHSLGLSAFDTYLGKVSTLYISKNLAEDETFAAVNGYYQKFCDISTYQDINLTNHYINNDYYVKNMTLKDVFDDLGNALVFFSVALQSNAYSAAVSAFEHINIYVADIMASEQVVKDAFCYQNHLPISQTEAVPLEYMYYSFASYYNALVGGLGDLYTLELKSFFADSYFVMTNTLLQGAEFGKDNATWKKIERLMAAYRELDVQSKIVFAEIDSHNVYHGGLLEYFETVLSDENGAKELAEKLLNAERAYTYYCDDNDGAFKDGDTFIDTFKKLMSEIKTGYAALSEADKKYLSDMYDYYVAVYDEMLAQAPETPSEP